MILPPLVFPALAYRGSLISYEENKCECDSGTVFTTFSFLLNLRMGAISQSVALYKAKRLFSDKHSSLLRTLVIYEENEVLLNTAPAVSSPVSAEQFTTVNSNKRKENV